VLAAQRRPAASRLGQHEFQQRQQAKPAAGDQQRLKNRVGEKRGERPCVIVLDPLDNRFGPT
jgi:hypothetical protein